MQGRNIKYKFNFSNVVVLFLFAMPCCVVPVNSRTKLCTFYKNQIIFAEVRNITF